MMTGYGFNEHAVGTAPALYDGLGASIVRLDYKGISLSRLGDLVKLYAKQQRLILVHSFRDAFEVAAAFPDIDIEYKNEPDTSNQDVLDPAQYVFELRMLAANGIYPWCGSVSTLQDLTYWNGLVKAGFLNVAKKVSVHLYGDQPEGLAARVKWLRGQVGPRPLLISEYGPGQSLAPKALADFMARTIKAVPSLGCGLVIYRMPEESKALGWGLVDTVTGLPNQAYQLLKLQVGKVSPGDWLKAQTGSPSK